MCPPNTPVLDPLSPPGPNRTHVQWNREWLAEMLVVEAAKQAREKVTPAPRLVGIETNPGPPPKLGTEIAAALGSLLATTKKKTKTNKKKKNVPKTKKKKSSASRGGLSSNMTTQVVSAPISRGVVMTRSAKHSPFTVSGRCYAFLLRTGTTSVNAELINQAGALMEANHFNIDPVSVSAVPSDFGSFPSTLRNIFGSFTRYRYKKLIAHYVPLVGTSTAGNITMASCSEVTGVSNTFSYGVVTAVQNSTTTPVWSPISLDLLAASSGGDGCRRDWLFMDSSASTSSAYARQESCGQFLYHAAGTPFNAVFGQIWWEYEVELDGIAAESNFTLATPSSSSCASSSSSSSSAPPAPRPTIRCESDGEPEHGLAESVYLPSSLLSSMGLKRA